MMGPCALPVAAIRFVGSFGLSGCGLLFEQPPLPTGDARADASEATPVLDTRTEGSSDTGAQSRDSAREPGNIEPNEACRDASCGLVFFSGFEYNQEDNQYGDWDAVRASEGAASVVWVESGAFRGQGASRHSLDASDVNTIEARLQRSFLISEDIFLQAMIRIPDLVLNSGVIVLLELFPQTEGSTKKVSLDYKKDGRVQIVSSALGGVTTSESKALGEHLGNGEWVCLELHLHLNSEAGYARALLDGTELARTPFGDTVSPSPADTLLIGPLFFDHSAGDGVRVDIDEVRLTTAPSPCPAPN